MDGLTRAILAITIWVAFIAFTMMIIVWGIPKGNEGLVTELAIALGTGVALVTNYYFKKRN